MRKKLLPALAGAVLITALFPGIALADPPQAIPANYEEADGKWQPAFDYDGDGCYPTPAISPTSFPTRSGLRTTTAASSRAGWACTARIAARPTLPVPQTTVEIMGESRTCSTGRR